jgi:hypothetical protein
MLLWQGAEFLHTRGDALISCAYRRTNACVLDTLLITLYYTDDELIHSQVSVPT